jgi:hypothetical protein
MTTVTVSLAQLKAALIFAAKKDVRHYLIGVHFRADGKIEACDGHRAIQMKGEEPAPAQNRSIPRDGIAAIIKGAGRYRSSIDIEFGETEWRAPLAGALGKYVDGVFPSVDRVLIGADAPTASIPDFRHVNLSYMADALEALKILGLASNKSNALGNHFSQSAQAKPGEASNYFHNSSAARIIVMGLRH